MVVGRDDQRRSVVEIGVLGGCEKVRNTIHIASLGKIMLHERDVAGSDRIIQLILLTGGEKKASLDGEIRCRSGKDADGEGEQAALEKTAFGVDDVRQSDDSAEFV